MRPSRPARPSYRVLGFDVGNNAMLLYGGKNGTDVGLPQVYWLYRYGSGSGRRPR